MNLFRPVLFALLDIKSVEEEEKKKVNRGQGSGFHGACIGHGQVGLSIKIVCDIWSVVGHVITVSGQGIIKECDFSKV